MPQITENIRSEDVHGDIAEYLHYGYGLLMLAHQVSDDECRAGCQKEHHHVDEEHQGLLRTPFLLIDSCCYQPEEEVDAEQDQHGVHEVLYRCQQGHYRAYQINY